MSMKEEEMICPRCHGEVRRMEVVGLPGATYIESTEYNKAIKHVLKIADDMSISFIREIGGDWISAYRLKRTLKKLITK